MLEIRTIYSDYTTLLAEDDTSVTAIVDLVKLYNSWLQNGIYNCENSGFGSDPSDLDDPTGATCNRNNSVANFKCKIQFRFRRLFNSYAGGGTLTF